MIVLRFVVEPSLGRDPTSLCVSRVFSLLNYDGGVCDNTA